MDLTKRITIFAAFLLGFGYFSASYATHIRGGYITATLIDKNSLTYRITLSAFTDAGSTVLFGGGRMDFGDGSEPVTFEAGKPDHFKLLDPQVALNVFIRDHSFPGPGEYTIGYREFNRNASIANMENSVNTSFYVETKILIDPYLGANSSAEILNYFPFKNKLDHPYFFPLNALDPDGDSISMEAAVPMQDKATPVNGYYVPANYDGNKILSQLQLHVPANEIIWANPLEEDEYNFAVKILEWRYNDSEKSWNKMGHTLFDFQVIISERIDQTPDVLNFGDTAVLSAMPFEGSFTVSDDGSDSVRIWISENIPGMNDFQTSIDEELYYPAPVSANISLNNTDMLLRPDPYKIVISVNPKEYRSTASQKSAMLWISERNGIPPAPEGLRTELAFRNTIIIHWDDETEIEAGFTVERADSFFPEFIRIAALPENTTEYVDNNVIPNRDYYYRVKAIGTSGSSFSDILEVREMDIVTGMDEQPSEQEILVFPNPVHDQLVISFKNGHRLPAALELMDIAGKSRYMHRIPERSVRDLTIIIPTIDLSAGIYFLILDFDGFRTVRKFVKK